MKDKMMLLFKIKTTKTYSKPTLIKNMYSGGKKPRKLKIQKQSEGNIIKNIRNSFRLTKKMMQSNTE